MQLQLSMTKYLGDLEKFNLQEELVRRCLSKNLLLHEELASIGWTYDDLQYSVSDYVPSAPEEASVDHVLSSIKPPSEIPFISFFSGAGGADLGFEAAGFTHAVSIEHNEIFCDTLKKNRSDWRVIGPPTETGNVSNIDELEPVLRNLLGRSSNFEGVFIGGPPCQPFSIAANQRFNKSGENFKRTGFKHPTNGNLLADYVWFIKHFKPTAFLIENVPGLLDIDNGTQLKKILAELSAIGYTILKPLLINAADYGVPQNRNRLFIIGSLKDLDKFILEKEKRQIGCEVALKGIPENAPNLETRKHNAASILRYQNLEFGKRDKLGRVDRLCPWLPSKTIIAGGSNGGGRSHLHPFIPRTLSVRESARIQTFPDNYEFTGPTARQFTQVGNAVPPVLAYKLANSILRAVF